MTLDQRKAGVVLSYLGQLVKIVSSLLYTPVMLRLLGAGEYGLYQLVFSVVSYLSLLSLGFGSSYIRFYSRLKAQNDDKGEARLNGMFLVIFLAISVVCILCGGVMIKKIHIIFGSGLTDSEYATAQKLMGLLVLNLALTFPNSVFSCAVTAHEEFLFQKLLILIQNICSPFLTLPLLIMGYGSVGMVLVTTVLTLTVLVSNVSFCIHKLHIEFLFKGFDFLLLKEMWVFTFFIFLNQIIDQINWSVDKFLLGRLAGTTAVAVYGVGGQINSMYLEFSTSISNVFVPQVNRIAAGSGSNKQLTKLFTKVGRIQFVILTLVLSCFATIGKSFVRFWAGESYKTSYAVALLLIVPVTVPLIQNLGLEIQRAKNLHKARAVVYLLIALGNVAVSIPLIKMAGPAGAAIGTAISLFLGNILFMNWYYQKRVGLDMIYFWKQIAAFVPALIVPCITGILIYLYAVIDNVLQMLFWGTVYTAVYCTAMYLFGMNENEKRIIKEPVRRMLRR